MSPHEITVSTAIVAFKTITLLLGAMITYLAYRAYQRTGQRNLRTLSVGFAIVTIGTLLAGVIDRVFASGFGVGLLVESALVAVGFVIIIYSLYVDL